MDSFGYGAPLHPAGYGVLPAGASALGSAATASRFASSVGTTAPSLPAPAGTNPGPGSYQPATGGSAEFTFVPAPTTPPTPTRSFTSGPTTPMTVTPTGDSTPGVVMPTGDMVQGRVVTTGDQSGTVAVTGDMIGAPRMVMPMGDQRTITNGTGEMNSPMVFPMADVNIVPKLPGGACPTGSSLQQNIWGGSEEFVCVAPAPPVIRQPGGECPPGSSYQAVPDSREFACVPDAMPPTPPKNPLTDCPPGSMPVVSETTGEFMCMPTTGGNSPMKRPPGDCPPGSVPVVSDTGEFMCMPTTGGNPPMKHPPGDCPPGSMPVVSETTGEFMCMPITGGNPPMKHPPGDCPPGSVPVVSDTGEFMCMPTTGGGGGGGSGGTQSQYPPWNPPTGMPQNCIDANYPLGRPTEDMTPNQVGPTATVGDFTPGSIGTGDRLGASNGLPRAVYPSYGTGPVANGPWVLGPTPESICQAGKCFPRPVRGNGQVIVNDRFRAPPGCVRIPSYGSYPAVSPWLAIPDGSPQTQTGWNNLPIVLGAGAASAPDDLLSQAGKLVMFGLGAYVGYKAVKRNFR